MNDVPQGDFLSKSRVIKSSFLRKIWSYLMVFGPGLIVMEADNDAGAVSAYTQAGGQYGTTLLWVMLLLLPITYFIQEMVVRLGITTGRGHADMIYQRFGKWWGRFSLLDLQILNFFTLVTEFAAINLALSELGISPFLSVPAAGIALIALAISGSYLRWERIVIVLALLDITWFYFAWKTHFKPIEVIHHFFIPSMPGGITPNLVFLIIALVGTTIAPWQLFFQQSAIANKRLRFSDLGMERLDTFSGAVFTILVAAAMIIVGNAMHTMGVAYENPAQMAAVLGHQFGSILKYGILLMMVNAAVMGATAISLSSAWSYAEVMGWPHSLQVPFAQAKGFYLTYIFSIMLAASIVLIPKAPLQLIILGVQVLSGLMLPSSIIFLQLLLNDKALLKEFANKPWNNWINWSIIIILFILSAILSVQVFFPNFAT